MTRLQNYTEVSKTIHDTFGVEVLQDNDQPALFFYAPYSGPREEYTGDRVIVQIYAGTGNPDFDFPENTEDVTSWSVYVNRDEDMQEIGQSQRRTGFSKEVPAEMIDDLLNNN